MSGVFCVVVVQGVFCEVVVWREVCTCLCVNGATCEGKLVVRG